MVHREGVDMERFERMFGQPHLNEHLEAAREVRRRGGTGPEFDAGDMEEIYMIAFEGNEAVSRFPGETYFDIMEWYDGKEWDTPYDRLADKLEEGYGYDPERPLIDWLHEAAEQNGESPIAVNGWEGPREFMEAVEDTSEFVSGTLGYDEETAPEVSEIDDYAEYRRKVTKIEDVMFEFQGLFGGLESQEE